MRAQLPVLLVALASACTLAGEDPLSSGYKNANIAVADSAGVADGHTPISVTVTGSPDVELVLEVTGQGARFQVGDDETGQERMVYLQNQGDGTGMATVGVVASQPGLAVVALKADRARTAREMDFQPVRMAAGAGVPMRLAPGLVMHQVCVAVNSASGILQLDNLDVPGAENFTLPGSFAPASLPVRAELPAGVNCPEATPDGTGEGPSWQGYALFDWATPVELAQVTLSYLGADNAVLANERLALSGEPFAGYSIMTNGPLTNPSWTSLQLSVSYQATETLSAGPAVGVRLQNVRFIPDSGPTFLGSSSGGVEEAPITDLDGQVDLFFDTAVDLGTYALFVTPENGSSAYLTDIEVQ